MTSRDICAIASYSGPRAAMSPTARSATALTIDAIELAPAATGAAGDAGTGGAQGAGGLLVGGSAIVPGGKLLGLTVGIPMSVARGGGALGMSARADGCVGDGTPGISDWRGMVGTACGMAAAGLAATGAGATYGGAATGAGGAGRGGSTIERGLDSASGAIGFGGGGVGATGDGGACIPIIVRAIGGAVGGLTTGGG
ncbi:MAG: hypothetical protein JWN44_5514, partial [Myxococcales bacterium]|nr:hypothetical protein [Myxococcales bacterium]